VSYNFPGSPGSPRFPRFPPVPLYIERDGTNCKCSTWDIYAFMQSGNRAIGQSGNRAIGLLWWDSGFNGFNGFNGFKIVKDS